MPVFALDRLYSCGMNIPNASILMKNPNHGRIVTHARYKTLVSALLNEYDCPIRKPIFDDLPECSTSCNIVLNSVVQYAHACTVSAFLADSFFVSNPTASKNLCCKMSPMSPPG